MKVFQEELLEPLARYFRFQKGVKEIGGKNFIIVDLGCGPKIRFYKFISQRNFEIKKYIGIDPLLDESLKIGINKNVRLIRASLSRRIPLKDGAADYVVGFAFLEHLNNPEKIVKESLRILKKGGKVIFTSPSNRARIVLEFLAFKAGLISKREILEHKTYFTKEILTCAFKNYKKGFTVKHQYFEFGLNNLIVIEKNK